MQLVSKEKISSQITYFKSDIPRQTRAHDYFTQEKIIHEIFVLFLIPDEHRT